MDLATDGRIEQRKQQRWIKFPFEHNWKEHFPYLNEFLKKFGTPDRKMHSIYTYEKTVR